MSRWWREVRGPRRRHLEEGLFQIASQTCNILVKVNNTTHTVRHEYGCKGPPTSPCRTVALSAGRDRSPTAGCAPRLETVLESGSVGASSSEEELEQWEQIFMMRDDSGHSYHDKKKHRSIWCRPSCAPVCVVLVVVALVVVVPLLDGPPAPPAAATAAPRPPCSDHCDLHLVESMPEGHMFPPDEVHRPTHDVWMELLESATTSVDIASLYWTLRYNEVYPYNTSVEGEEVFQGLVGAAARGVAVRVAQNLPTKENPNRDTDYLLRKKVAQVRSLNFSKLLGGGVLHTKFWIVDSRHVYLGSANMDWRSLTQVKELGVVAYNCTCLAADLAKIFSVYWMMGAADAAVPAKWPADLGTRISRDSPANITTPTHSYQTYISSSPPPFSPAGRTDDWAAIVDTIGDAERFVYIAVMDYQPATVFTPIPTYWPVIDDAMRRAAVERRVEVRLLVSWWRHSRPDQDHYLRSLAALNNIYPHVRVYCKRFIVPSTPAQQQIPFARVNHNKYLVTDAAAYIGTSNWSGDYFIDTAGVALVLQHPHAFNHTAAGSRDLRAQLQAVFERDWNSPYAVPLPTR